MSDHNNSAQEGPDKFAASQMKSEGYSDEFGDKISVP